MHSWQIMNPQRQRQQKGTSFSTAMADLGAFLPPARPAYRPGCSVVHGYRKLAEALLF
jgi:hypothetical protein